MPDDAPDLNPTDIRILEALADWKYQTPKNLSVILDADASYISSRARSLIRRGYAMDLGPADRSGMIEINRVGRVAADHLDHYCRTHSATFRNLCERVVAEQSGLDDDAFDTARVGLTNTEQRIREAMRDTPGVCIPLQIPSRTDVDGGVDETAAALYALFFYGLADRHEGMNA